MNRDDMKTCLKRLPVALLAALAMATISANATNPLKGIEVICPQEVKLQSLAAPIAPDGWTPLLSGVLMLNGVDLTSGSPAEKATLLPEIAGQGKSAVRKWKDLRAYGDDGIWVACKYGRSENAVLGQKINAAVSECIAVDRIDGYGQSSISIACH